VTQPLTYQKILNHPTTLQIYSQKLLNEDIISQDVCSAVCKPIISFLLLGENFFVVHPIIEFRKTCFC
jgi:2-oxoglutarate dehydrogenase complex dehydrogenase (E1) component-like enzyme